MKSCPKEEFLQAYLDNELAVEAEATVRAHLAVCSLCSVQAQEMEQAFAVLGNAFMAELPDAVPSARLRARIEAALAEKAAPSFVWAQSFWRFGLAAAVLLVAGIAGWTLLGKHSTRQQQVYIEKPKPSVTPEPQQLKLPTSERKPEMVQQAFSRHRVRRNSRINKADNSDENAEIVTQFFPLREDEDLTALEGKQLLRVELPGSALREAGFPVDFETAQTSVIADVVLGQDGLARAIRFVR